MSQQPKPVLQVGQAIIQHALAIEKYFSLPVNVTIIVRVPGHDDADVVLTCDTLDELYKVLIRSDSRPAVTNDEIYGREKSNGKEQQAPPAPNHS